ncbi:hypothetical protein MMC13_001117 [Lambiella insularis]|nr:hypothetical protein [Lambiella insularis]
MRFLLLIATAALPLLAAGQRYPIHAREAAYPGAYDDLFERDLYERDLYDDNLYVRDVYERDPYEPNYNQPLFSRNPGNNPSKNLTPHCDAGADRSCTQGSPCKSGTYKYNGNNPYQAATAQHCERICSCK